MVNLTLRDVIGSTSKSVNMEMLYGFGIGDVVTPKLGGGESFPIEYYGSEGVIILQDDIEGYVKLKFGEKEIQVGKASDLDLVRRAGEVDPGPFDINSIALLREQYYSRSIGIIPSSLTGKLIDGYFSVPYFIDKNSDIDASTEQSIVSGREKTASVRVGEFWNGLCSTWGITDSLHKKFLINSSIKFVYPSRVSSYGGMEPQVFWDLKNKFEDLITSILKVGNYDPDKTSTEEDLIDDLS